jgi:hypothetical protein
LLHIGADPPERQQRALDWSHWRRIHQATAKRCHAARRARRDGRPPPVTQLRGMGMPGTPMLTDALWQHLAPLFPARTGKRGRAPSDARPILAGLFWMMRAGVGWREIPSQYGPWHTIYSRYQQWCREGTWTQIVAALPPTEV